MKEKAIKTINPTNDDIDKLWAEEAEKRVEDIKSGKVKTIDGKKVFQNPKMIIKKM